MLTVTQAVMTMLSTTSTNQDAMTAAVMQSINGKAAATIHGVQSASADREVHHGPGASRVPG